MSKNEVLEGLQIILGYFNSACTIEDDEDWLEEFEYYCICVEKAIDFIKEVE